MGLRHILWTRAEAANGENIIGHSFAVTATRPRKIDARWCIHDPFPATTCRRVAERLRGDGFDVSDIWRCKPWGAGFHVNFSDFEVLFMISTELGNSSIVEYGTMSWCSRPFWRHPNPERVVDDWNRVIDKIERILSEDTQITSLRRRSEL